MTLPKLNIEVAEDGFRASDGDAVMRSNVGQGPSRSRRDFVGASGQGSITLQCDESEYDYWRAFYNTTIAEGALPFLLDLVFDDSTLRTYEVKMTGPPSEGVKGLLQTVAFSVEIKKPQRDAAYDAALVLLWGEYGDGTAALLAALDLLANDALPGDGG